MSRRVLFDLNVILDVLLDRAPFAEHAAALWAQVEQKRAQGLISAHGVTTLHCLASRHRGPEFAARCVADVLQVFEVAPVTGSVLTEALALGWADFEDAVCAAAARAAGCQVIATRDPRGFRGSVVPAMAPDAALALTRLKD